MPLSLMKPESETTPPRVQGALNGEIVHPAINTLQCLDNFCSFLKQKGLNGRQVGIADVWTPCHTLRKKEQRYSQARIHEIKM